MCFTIDAHLFTQTANSCQARRQSARCEPRGATSLEQGHVPPSLYNLMSIQDRAHSPGYLSSHAPPLQSAGQAAQSQCCRTAHLMQLRRRTAGA